MKQIYLMRHGQAIEPGTPEFEDDDRPLTRIGEKRVAEIAEGLRLLDMNLERIVSSPLPRAQRTAEIVAESLHARTILEIDDALRADRDAESIRSWLGNRHEERIMLIGHNPTFSELLSLLILNKTEPLICDLRKGSVAALCAEETAEYRLDWLARPRLVRRWLE